MKKIVCVFASIFALNALAFHLQISVSGYSHIYEQYYRDKHLEMVGTPWSTWTEEIGGGGEIYEVITVYRILQPTYYGDGIVFNFGPNDDATKWLIKAYKATDNTIQVTPNESVYLGTIGNVVDSYGHTYDQRIDDCVLTVRGDPYSAVINDTDFELTINGVTFEPHSSHKLFMPLHMDMGVPLPSGYAFFDSNTGERITTFGGTDGNYLVRWSGDIRIAPIEPISPMPPAEALVYGDETNKLLYAKNNDLIYADPLTVVTNLHLMTWWDFDQNTVGRVPEAYINDECVCGAHSTGHIIDYNVATAGMKRYGDMASVDFTMSLKEFLQDDNCAFRCWDANQGSTTNDYYSTQLNHRAEVIGMASTLARFRLTLNLKSGEWKVEPKN